MNLLYPIGTLFGVPHSTLEYKVKERHLLRPKKRLNETNATKKESSNKNGNNRVINGSTDVSNSSTVNSTNVSNSSIHSFWPSALPFGANTDVNASGNSHNNFFASDMMRKLQENARLNQDVGVKSHNDQSGEYGGLLLESLIKSSLINNALNRKQDFDRDEEEENNNNNNNNNNNDEDMKDEEEEEDEKKVVNTSLELLKEVSALVKKD